MSGWDLNFGEVCRAGVTMKEIGGYFGLEQLAGREYHAGLTALNTCRNALLYVLKARKAKKLYIPRWLCGSVSGMCERYGIVYDFYSVDENFLPAFHKIPSDDEYVLIVNYYGQISNETAQEMKGKYKNIIFDCSQAFFQRPPENTDTLYSCRKFFGVPDGAYLSTDAPLEDELETDVSTDRMSHLLGRFEGCASDHYAEFRKNEDSLEEIPLRRMSLLTKNILGAIDYEKVREVRTENFKFLHERLGGINRLALKVPGGAYAYPFYCRNGSRARKILAESLIYVPVLWPNVLEDNSENSREYDLASNILPLPCDQRYGKEDMEHIAEMVIAEAESPGSL